MFVLVGKQYLDFYLSDDAIFSDEIISTEYGLEHRLFVCEVCNKKHSGVFFYSIACI